MKEWQTKGSWDGEEWVPRETLVRMEILAMLSVSIGLMALALIKPAPLGEMADAAATPKAVTAPWIFIWIQELLRHLPAFVGGVVVPAALFLFLSLLPFLRRDFGPEDRPGNVDRLLPIALLAATFLGLVILSILHFLRQVS
ncbi:MAG: hypothetical protein R3231_08155 [bacterium]|nr:hypothetical protein [bacterium]